MAGLSIITIILLAVIVLMLTAIVPKPINSNSMKFKGVIEYVYEEGVNNVYLVIKDIP